MNRKKKILKITDDLCDISNVVIAEEIELLLPYAETLLGPMITKNVRTTDAKEERDRLGEHKSNFCSS